MEYQEFLKQKMAMSKRTGFKVQDADINPLLFPHQKDIVKWALDGGRRAIFAAFGLGKSFMQLECMRLIQGQESGRQLIICPLGVRQEFKQDSAKLGIELTFIRRNEELGGDGIYITNYESVRDGRLSVDNFNAVSLDEASVLRSYGSKTYQSFLTLFAGVKYRFVATATPSPNRYKELIHYAGFLGIMDTGQALTRFFQRDSQKANNLTLYPHKEKEFWAWLGSWAIFLQKPSDLGYSDEGYSLPKLHVHYHKISSGVQISRDRDGQLKFVCNSSLSLSAASTEKRRSMGERVEKAMEIISSDPDNHYIIWHDQEKERHAIKKALPEAVEVFGSLDLETREQRIIDFSNGKYKYLATKPVLSGSGCNFQRHCHNAIFMGIGFKFNDFIQAVHRIYRFLQDKECHVHLIYTDKEIGIMKVLREKWNKHNEMVERMSELIQKHGLSNRDMIQELERDIGVKRIAAMSDVYELANNDCVDETRRMDENSVDLIHTSIPFSNHYEYTPSYNDFGHTDGNEHFWNQMDYLTPELLRVLKPGRIYACHVKDRILFGNVTGKGAPTVSPFHAECIFHGQKHGFDYMGMITVITDVVRENNQTYRLGWSENAKDGTKMGVGSPEYIIIFRKPQTDRTKGYADMPVAKSKQDYSRARWQIDAHAFWRSSGDRLLTPDELAKMGPDELASQFTKQSLMDIYSYEEHIKIGEALESRNALPSTFMAIAPGSWHKDVWHDINRMRTLNSDQKRRNLNMHVCLARHSLVLTKRGHVPIQDVQVGDLVLTHKGRWKKVQVVAKTGFKEVVSLKAQGVPNMILTPEHKLWTRISNWKRERDGAKHQKPEWIRADETLNGYVNLKLPPIEHTELNHQECWILGRWLADGHVGTRGDYFISVGHDKLDHFFSKAGDLAGTRRDGTAMQVRLKGLSERLKRYLKQCNSGAENKEVPASLLCIDKDKAGEVLAGYLSGDGHLLENRSRWMATSVSRKLLLGMAMLAQRVFNTVPSVYAGRIAGTTNIEGREVNTKQEWNMSFDLPSKSRRKSQFILNDGAWKKVRDVEYVGKAETWCLQVEDDASFTAEGCIVKNCPLQFDIVDRIITRYSNKGETIYDPFGGIMTVPYRAVKLGRKAKASELNHGYWLDGVKYCRAAAEKINTPSLLDFVKEKAA